MKHATIITLCLVLMSTHLVSKENKLKSKAVYRPAKVIVKTKPAKPSTPPKNTAQPKPARPAKPSKPKVKHVYVKHIAMNVTAYSAPCRIQGTGLHTASGRRTMDKNGKHTVGVAVDPKVIPLGSVVVIDGKKYVADDTGGGIKGNRLDLRVASRSSALRFGRKKLVVAVYRKVKI